MNPIIEAAAKAHWTSKIARYHAQYPDGHNLPSFDELSEDTINGLMTDMRAALRAMAECERLREVIEKVDWVWIRSVLAQGASIYQDYQAGTHKTYEHYSSRLDVAAVERKEELQTVMRDALEEA